MKLGIFGVLVAVLLVGLVGALHPQTTEARVGKPAVAPMANGDLRISWARDPYLQLGGYEVQIRDALSPRLVFAGVTDDDATFMVINRSSLIHEQGKMRVRVRSRRLEAGTDRWLVGRWSQWSTPFVLADFVTGWKLGRLANGDLIIKWKPVLNAARYEAEIECAMSGCTDSQAVSVPGSNIYATLSTQAGMVYRVRVRAIKANGDGPWMNWVYETSPAAFSGVANLSVRRLVTGKIRVNWDRVPDAQLYHLEIRCASPPCPIKVRTFTPGYSWTLDTALKSRARVRVVDTHGTQTWSDWVSETPLPVLPDINDPVIGSDVNGDLLIDWDKVEGAAQYHVQLACKLTSGSDPACAKDKQVVGAPRTHVLLSPSQFVSNGIYRARVRAVDPHGARAWSDWVPVTPIPSLDAIGSPEARWLADGRLSISWAPMRGAEWYLVEIGCAIPACTDNRTVGVGEPQTQTVVSVTGSGDYRVRVRAGNKRGPRAWSDWSAATHMPLLAPVDRPTVKRLSNGNLRVELVAVGGASHYRFEILCVRAGCSSSRGGFGVANEEAWPAGTAVHMVIPAKLLDATDQYHARVRAGDVHGVRGWSAWSDEAQ